MIIILSNQQYNYLFNVVLISHFDLKKKLNENSFLINDNYKFELSTMLANQLLSICLSKLKIATSSYDVNMIEGIIDRLNKSLSDYYLMQHKENLLNKSALDECISLLGDNVTIIKDPENIKEIFRQFTSIFKFTEWGRIDWNKIVNHQEVNNIHDILNVIPQENDLNEVYILWNDADLPIIKTYLYNALRTIEEITALGSDTWLYSSRSHFVIEFFHDGQVTIGKIE